MNIYDFSSILAAGGRDGQHTIPPFRIRLRAQHLRSLSTNLFQNGCDFMETSSVFFFSFLNWIPASGSIVWYLLAPSVPNWERFFIP